MAVRSVDLASFRLVRLCSTLRFPSFHGVSFAETHDFPFDDHQRRPPSKRKRNYSKLACGGRGFSVMASLFASRRLSRSRGRMPDDAVKKATISSPADLRRATNVSVAKDLPYGRLIRLLSESYGDDLPGGLLTKDELVEAASGLGIDLAALLHLDGSRQPDQDESRHRVCYDQEGIVDNFSSSAAAGLVVRRAPRSATPQNMRMQRRMSSPEILQGRGQTNADMQHSYLFANAASSSFPPHQPTVTRPPGGHSGGSPGKHAKHKKKGLARKRAFSKKFLTLGRESRSEDRPAAIFAQIRKGSMADAAASPGKPQSKSKDARRKTANPVYRGTTAFIHDITVRGQRRGNGPARKSGATAAPLHDITVRPPKRSAPEGEKSLASVF